MKRQFAHDLFSSFTLFFDNTLLRKGEAFTNSSGRLFYTKDDDSLANYSVYASPFKQWVYDSSISGATVPSGVYVNNSFIPRSGSGLRIDFNNGRAIFPSGSPSWNVSGNYAVKDFNIYRTTRSDEEIVFSNRFMFNPEFPKALTGVKGDKIIAPAIFLKLTHISNEPFEMGGMDETTVYTRAIILSDSEFDIDAVGNIFADTKYNNFPMFPKTPLNEFNDVKGGYYSYQQYITDYFNNQRFPYIANVGYSRLLTVGVKTIDPDMSVGFLDFTIKVNRQT